jgi:hypothetical protein
MRDSSGIGSRLCRMSAAAFAQGLALKNAQFIAYLSAYQPPN